MPGGLIRTVVRCSGAAFVVGSTAAIPLLGSLPPSDAAGGDVVAYLEASGTRLLAVNALLAVVYLGYLVFFAALRALVRADPGAEWPATGALASALGVVAVYSAGGLLGAGLAWHGVGGMDPDHVDVLWDVGQMANSYVGPLSGLAIGLASLSARALVPGFVVWLGGAVAVLGAATPLSLLTHHPLLAPGGQLTVAASVVPPMAWIAAVSATVAVTPADGQAPRQCGRARPPR